MSVYGLVIAVALAGQLSNDDRYGNPPGESASDFGELSRAAGGPPPLTGTARGVSERPPPIVPRTQAAPTTMPDNFGLSTPAASTPLATVPSDAEPGLKPSAMMRAMLGPPPGSRLTGRPIRLVEVVAGASSRQEQSQRIEAYWDLCSSVADYYLGVREQDELQQLRASVSNVGPTWQQAESELGVRIGTSQRAAVASQYRLASLMGRADATSLPLPADLPHCGDYYARYDQVFAGRGHPPQVAAEAHELSELLPMRYEELTGAAMAITRAEEFLDAIAAQRSSSGDGTGTLRALELLALRRRAFVQIARDYNRRIARYVELASPGQIDAERLISMLIKREGSANTATRPATSTPLPNRQSQTMPDDPAQTFVEGWAPLKRRVQAPRDEAVQPASAEANTPPRREHSLLVPSE